MKELSIEEKAKRYDEAVKRVENIKTGKCETIFMFTEGLFEYIFPELAESEDERTRKEIIYHIQNCDDTINEETEKRMLAWLEKQGEQKPAWSAGDINKPNGGIVMEDFNDGNSFYKVNLAYLNKEQVEEIEELVKRWNLQPKGNEDESIINDLLDYFDEDKCLKHEVNDIVKWLKTIKPQQKGWGENEIKMLDNLITYLEGRKDLLEEIKRTYIDWLKSLKDRVQPKQEWSEEDETRLNSTIKHLEEHEGDTPSPLRPYIWEDIKWIKSLKPQSHWKPSDEQMEALKNVFEVGCDDKSWAIEKLKTLYNELKNLK